MWRNVVILFGSQAQTGKDTSANILVQKFGYKKFSFATKLKQTVADLYDFTYEQMYGKGKEIIDERYSMTPRKVLQDFGQEQRKRYPTMWADYVYREIQKDIDGGGSGFYCVADFRFRNEHSAAKSFFDFKETLVVPIKMLRDVPEGLVSGSNDVSEHDLDNFTKWSYLINNNGSIEHLEEVLTDIHNGLK